MCHDSRVTLDPSAQSVLSMFAESDRPSPDALPIAEAREGYALLSSLGGTGAEVASVDRRRIAGVPCVVITPIDPGDSSAVDRCHLGSGPAQTRQQRVSLPCLSDR